MPRMIVQIAEYCVLTARERSKQPNAEADKKIKQAGADLLQGEVERIVNSYAMYASWYDDSENIEL